MTLCELCQGIIIIIVLPKVQENIKAQPINLSDSDKNLIFNLKS